LSPVGATYFNVNEKETDRDWRSRNNKGNKRSSSSTRRKEKDDDDEDRDDRNVVQLEGFDGEKKEEEEGEVESNALQLALRREIKLKKMLVAYLIVFLGVFVLLMVLAGSLGTCQSRLAECNATSPASRGVSEFAPTPEIRR
jgi:hypothetical protein